MVFDSFVDLIVSMFSQLIGLFQKVRLSISGFTISYWQFILGFLLLSFIIFTFWRGAKS